MISPIRILVLGSILLARAPIIKATSPDEDVKTCAAGNEIDTACMQKHRIRFEKYVIDGNDSYLKRRDGMLSTTLSSSTTRLPLQKPLILK